MTARREYPTPYAAVPTWKPPHSPASAEAAVRGRPAPSSQGSSASAASMRAIGPGDPAGLLTAAATALAGSVAMCAYTAPSDAAATSRSAIPSTQPQSWPLKRVPATRHTTESLAASAAATGAAEAEHADTSIGSRVSAGAPTARPIASRTAASAWTSTSAATLRALAAMPAKADAPAELGAAAGSGTGCGAGAGEGPLVPPADAAAAPRVATSPHHTVDATVTSRKSGIISKACSSTDDVPRAAATTASAAFGAELFGDGTGTPSAPSAESAHCQGAPTASQVAMPRSR
mmetsp:Transcript_18450/g.69901  ORF Transcript_18450/g.69901 Transcript_18450/m.69901 type:complete len:290 (+) Transcript_18450:1665-2534(+)